MLLKAVLEFFYLPIFSAKVLFICACGAGKRSTNIIMIVFSSHLGIAAVALIALLHIFGVILPGIYGKIAKYINICLHIPLGAFLVYLGSPIEEGVLIYMGSLFLYLLLGYINSHRGEGER